MKDYYKERLLKKIFSTLVRKGVIYCFELTMMNGLDQCMLMLSSNRHIWQASDKPIPINIKASNV
jgi:hypothetical protein